jgi:hypothetical protein
VLTIPATRHQITALIGLRGLLGRAESAARVGTAIARIEALILIDFAAETVAKMSAQSLGLRPMHDVQFPVVLAELAAALEARKARLQYKAEAIRLHRIRNSAQHEFVSPDLDVLTQAIADCMSFSRQLVAEVWGLELNDLSQAEAIEDEVLRRAMTIAESAIDTADGRKAIVALAGAAHELRMRLSWRDRDRPYSGWERELGRAFGGLRSREFEPLGRAIDSLMFAIDLLGAGFSGRDVRWLVDFLPRAFATLDGTVHVSVALPLPPVADMRRAFQILLAWITDAEPLPTKPVVRFLGSGPEYEQLTLPPGWPRPEDV